MVTFCINTLSANRQCNTSDDILKSVSNLVDCFKHLLPAIERGRIRLVYDACIEDRELSTGQHIKSSISTLESDIRKQWYVYTKNHAHQASCDLVAPLSITPKPNFYMTNNQISQDLLRQHTKWLSFSGQQWTESPEYAITAKSHHNPSIKNAHNLDSLIPLLPSYEESPKHHRDPYYANGEYVSPMPLEKKEAAQLLLVSVPDQTGTDRWAFHETLGKYFRFKLTYVHQNIYHGFEVENMEVPFVIQQLLVN
jgi:hypothetical protein